MLINNPFKPLIISVLTAFIYLLVLSNNTGSWASPEAVRPSNTQLVRAINLVKSGDFKKAEEIVNNIIESEPKNQQTVALSWQVLGNALNGSGQYPKAIAAYRQSLSLRSSLPVYNNLVKASISYRLENSASPKTIKPSSQIWRDAIKTVEMGDRQNTISSIYAYTNWVDLTGNKISSKRLKHARKILDRASPSRSLIYASINWGSKVEPERQLKWLTRAKSTAFFLDDKLAQAQVLLELGNFYSHQGNLSLALRYANQTINLAAANAYYSISYRAEFLAGQTYQQQRKFRAALRAYKNAIVSLEAIDKDLYVSKSSVQIARFKTESAIVYKRAIELLLENNPTSSQLEEVLDISGKLRITELQSFFGDDCLEISSKTVDNVDSQAVVSSIILEDRTVVILRLPDGNLISHTAEINSSDLRALATNWRLELVKQQTRNYQSAGKTLYNLLIRPIELHLIDAKIKTIVFVHDGVLRNIPMSALFDGEKYLVEKWSSISSLGVDASFSSKSKDLKGKSKALIFALSKPIQAGWTELAGVETEIEAVDSLLDSNEYLNEKFTNDNFYEQLARNTFYNIIHIASHGSFGSSIESSFILSYDNKISMSGLENSLRNQTDIDLLVLSACETAVGSDLSSLSIAGVAARSGVRTTLGSLWQVDDDDQSEVIANFYQHWLNSGSSKAEALQKIQIEYIKKFAHPNKWATLNLIGEDS